MPGASSGSGCEGCNPQNQKFANAKSLRHIYHHVQAHAITDMPKITSMACLEASQVSDTRREPGSSASSTEVWISKFSPAIHRATLPSLFLTTYLYCSCKPGLRGGRLAP